MAEDFGAKVTAWVRKTKARQEAVFRTSVERFVEAMQTPVGRGGNMPVDTGFLRSSLVANLSGDIPLKRERPSDEASYSPSTGEVVLVIENATLKDTITLAYTASYARFAEYGARGRAGRRFMTLAAQRWNEIVNQTCREAYAGRLDR